jgi:hypothetical protein
VTRALRVSVLGPPELFADKTVSLLCEWGIDAQRPDPPKPGLRGRFDRIRRGLATDIFLHMCGRQDLGRLQAWLSRLGVPTLIVWIGSDVPRFAAHTSSAVATRAWHWTVAPWLQEEVADAGIAAEVVPLTPPPIPTTVPPLPEEFSVLAYTLDGRSDLYGLDFILELARRRPDIPFVLLGATPSESFPKNVRAIKQLEDTDATMRGSTLYVRPTLHDGLSNLVLEALAHGRYVMWTHPFPGVDQIGSIDSAEARLNELHGRHVEGRLSPNHEGRDAIARAFDRETIRKILVPRLTAVSEQGWTGPPGPALRKLASIALRGFKAALRADPSWISGERVV